MINVKSPHFPVHDLDISTRSVQASYKKEDVITASQTVVSQHSAEFSHRQDRPRCRPDDSCRSHTRNSTSFAQRFHAESGSGHLLMMLELIFHWTKLRSILIGFHLPTSVICPMGFTNGLTDNTIRITMTIHTQIQNQPFVSCKFNSFQIGSRQSFAASATAGSSRRVRLTIHVER